MPTIITYTILAHMGACDDGLRDYLEVFDFEEEYPLHEVVNAAYDYNRVHLLWLASQIARNTYKTVLISEALTLAAKKDDKLIHLLPSESIYVNVILEQVKEYVYLNDKWQEIPYLCRLQSLAGDLRVGWCNSAFAHFHGLGYALGLGPDDRDAATQSLYRKLRDTIIDLDSKDLLD